MKSLQKLVCMIFLLSIVAAGCKQSISSPSPDGSTGDKVEFSLKDKNGNDVTLLENGSEVSAKVKTSSATLSVKAAKAAGKDDVKIAGKSARSHTFKFDANGQEKTVNVSVVQSGTTKNYTVKVKYYSGALKKLTVKDDNSKEVHVAGMGLEYTASVGTKKATVSVETFDSSDKVKIDGTETKSATVTFAGTETKKELKVSIIHENAEEKYSVKIYYSDPSQLPVDPELKNIKITNSANASQEFTLSPAFNSNNTRYSVIIPQTVSKIKVDATAEAGIRIEGDGEHSLNVGDNEIIIKAILLSDPAAVLEYKINAKKINATASNNANLATLEIISKVKGIPTKWKTKDWGTQTESEKDNAVYPFDPNTITYTCTAEPKCDEFVIKAKPADAGAIMTIKAASGAEITLPADTELKVEPFTYGDNTFTLKITAPNGSTTKQYTINAKRLEGSYLLKTLTGTGLDDFYNGMFEKYKNGTESSKSFNITAPKSLTGTTITAQAEYPSTTTIQIKVVPYGTKPKDVEYKELTGGSKDIPLTTSVTVYLKLTSTTLSQGWGNEYILDIKKPSNSATADSEAQLDKLELSYYSGATFYALHLAETWSPDKYDYTLSLPAFIKEIKAEAVPKSNKAYIEGWGGKTNRYTGPFNDKEIKINVVAEDGTKKTYTVKISQFAPPTLTINLPEDTVIDVSSLTATSGYKIEGTFNDPENLVSEIWAGSSGLPIQEKLGKKWKKATTSGNTFTAELFNLQELPNGKRDIKVAAYDIRNNPIAVARVPVIIQNSKIETASVKTTITTSYNLPREGKMSLVVYDYDYWQQGENVILGYSEKELKDIYFPSDVLVRKITAKRDCLIMVEIYDEHNSLVYYGSEKLKKETVEPNKTVSCTIDIKKAQ
ncbi:MAG: cadherin-like beta sandwich domain-containing protein [Treponema sp.]